MATIWGCLYGPKLKRIYREMGAEGRLYKASLMETCGDGVIKTVKGIVWTLTLYTSPLIVPILYKKNYLTRDRCLTLIKFSMLVGCIFVGSHLLRGIGRYLNPDYVKFLLALGSAKANLTQSAKKQLSKYDFCFWAWPVEFHANLTESDSKKLSRLAIKRLSKRMTVVETIKALPCQMLSYAIAHTIGRRLLYPGSLQLVQTAMDPHLSQGRLKYIEEYFGERFKLETRERNEIDCMFVDRRNSNEHINGNTLVICCEGNAGFYEMGIMDTPLNAQFSVLGWNHPGFAGSSGEPFPEQEQNAVDVVVQFAIEHLHFKVENIVIYAWSIGGYTATWAAVNYPDIQGLVLDATFDDILPLAVNSMPRSWKPLVATTIRDHLNLQVAEQLNNYNGPVIIFRRLKDEVITSGESNNLAANRGNFLLLKMLQYRYPNIFDEKISQLLMRWITSKRNDQIAMWHQINVDDNLCQTLASTCITEEYGKFPSSLGDGMDHETKSQMALFLASRHLTDYDATHCQPLPSDLFSLPWQPFNNSL